MAIIIRPGIAEKIGRDDHGNITSDEVQECFANHDGRIALDPRPQHLDRAGNPSPWFVAPTKDDGSGRTLKIMFVVEGADVELKSAYPATGGVEALFERIAR